MEKLLHPAEANELEMTKTLKIPDFMSRLRVVLDIDGIEIAEHLLRDSASEEELEELSRILLKRAFIIAHQMQTHWKTAARIHARWRVELERRIDQVRKNKGLRAVW